MNRFSIWGLIRRTPAGTYRVRVRAIPLQDGVPFSSGDELSGDATDFVQATHERDHLVEKLKARVTGRGDTVASVDSSFEI